MATSVNTSLPLWLSGCTYDGNGGNDLRNSGVAAYFYDEGIVNGGNTIGTLGGVIGGAGLIVNAGTGMTVTVQPGHYVVPNSGTPTAGAYVSTLTSLATLTVQTADPSNPRIDIVVAYVSDVGSSASFGAVEIITGTAAPSPSVPTAPANSITLAQITVTAGATSITGGMVADVRPFTVATGGVLVARKGSVIGYRGQIAYDAASGAFYHNNNTSNASQMHVLPWEPVVVSAASPVTVSNTNVVTVASTTITCDGYTDVEIFFKWPGFLCNAGNSTYYSIIFTMYVDSNVVDTLITPEANGDDFTQGGGCWSYFTSSATGDTPSAGTHTVKVTAALHRNTSISTQINGSTGNIILLRVEPVAM